MTHRNTENMSQMKPYSPSKAVDSVSALFFSLSANQEQKSNQAAALDVTQDLQSPTPLASDTQRLYEVDGILSVSMGFSCLFWWKMSPVCSRPIYRHHTVLHRLFTPNLPYLQSLT